VVRDVPPIQDASVADIADVNFQLFTYYQFSSVWSNNKKLTSASARTLTSRSAPLTSHCRPRGDGAGKQTEPTMPCALIG
jgi:hypothetical protein